MNETTYSLEWRGARKTGLSYADIEAGLASGDLHSLYKIQVNGKWTVLRDFLEQQRALPATSPAGRFNSPQPAPSPLPRPEPSAPLPPLAPLVKAMPPASGGAVQKPVWFWPVIIIASTVCLLLIIVLAYMAAMSRSSSQRTTGSSSYTTHPISSAKASRSSDLPRDKSNPSTTTDHNLTNEEIADIKSPYVVTISTFWKEPDKKSGKLVPGGSTGSGVHIKDDKGCAYFVTNRHVVAVPKKAQDIECSLVFNGEEVPFEIVKQGRYDLDLAMLRVKHTGEATKPPLRSARLEELRPGQECVAIGNALGGGISITTGVISAFDEWGEGKFVRTSAPISSGNSGGGLFRTKDGALIGITTLASTSSQTEAIQNINLAIPMDYVLSDLFWEDR